MNELIDLVDSTDTRIGALYLSDMLEPHVIFERLQTSEPAKEILIPSIRLSLQGSTKKGVIS